MKNLEQYKGDLERLIVTGESLGIAMKYENEPEAFEKALRNLPPLFPHL